MSLPKKILLFSLVGIVSFIGILPIIVFFLIGILSIFPKDILPINDTDLQLEKVEVVKEENSYYQLIKIEEIIDFSENEAKIISNYAKGKDWDEDFVKKLISKNQKALSVFDAAVEKTYFQDPEFTDPTKVSISSLVTSLKPGDILKITNLSSIKAISAAKKGQDKKAFDEALKSIKLGHKMQNSQGSLIHYFLGTAIKSIGLYTVQDLLKTTSLDNSSLKDYLSKISEYSDNKKGLELAIKIEYTVQVSAVDSITESIDPNEAVQKLAWGSFLFGKKIEQSSFYFQPNKTKKMFADNARLVIKDIDKPCGIVEQREVEKVAPSNAIEMLFTENAIGKMIHDITLISFGPFQNKRCDVELLVSATRLLVAMKMFKTDLSTYPSSLVDLIPDYIIEIPVDPYDGKPIRYSSSKKIIYSVGQDLIDSGGSTGDNLEKMKDPTFKIAF